MKGEAQPGAARGSGEEANKSAPIAESPGVGGATMLMALDLLVGEMSKSIDLESDTSSK